MNDRDVILSRVRKALEGIPAEERAPLPDWDQSLATYRSGKEYASGWEEFSERMKKVHGIPLEGFEALRGWLKEQGCNRGYVDPEFADEFTDCQVETTFDPGRVDDYEFGVTRASAVIAETGTVVLKDGDSVTRLGTLAPWIHVAIVEADRILSDVSAAIRFLGNDPYVVFATGPSKTADVEGILIEGVHGPGKQVCCLVKSH